MNDDLREKLAARLAAPMFFASFLFLTVIAASINRTIFAGEDLLEDLLRDAAVNQSTSAVVSDVDTM